MSQKPSAHSVLSFCYSSRLLLLAMEKLLHKTRSPLQVTGLSVNLETYLQAPVRDHAVGLIFLPVELESEALLTIGHHYEV